MVSETKKASNRKWDLANRRVIGAGISVYTAERFEAICMDEHIAPSRKARQLIEKFVQDHDKTENI